MRNINMEAAIWNLFVSADFFEAAARESEATMRWFGGEATEEQVVNLGRNNQIYDTFKKLARNLRRGAELAALGDYKLIWNTADCFRGDVRGMMDQPLRSWMSDAEYQEFFDVRIDRISAYTSQITRALNNAMTAADCFFAPDPDYPERSNDDDGFAGDEIVKVYDDVNRYKKQIWTLPDPLPEVRIDRSIACNTGDEVPWTGVWYPDTGLDQHSLTFAIKGLRMQPAFRVAKTKAEMRAEGILCGGPETVAVATTWHPLVPTGRPAETNGELWAKAGAPCPRAGIWQATDPGTSPRTYEAGEPMRNLGSAYGLTVWRWVAER